MSEMVLVIGYPAAGKTTITQEYVDKGYFRVNRDELGGKLYNLPEIVKKSGKKKVILDNTYADIESRKGIIECGKQLGMDVKCVWLQTSIEDAQYNACQRMIRKTGKLLMPEDKTNDPNLFPVSALFSYRKRFQKPTLSEGFSSIENVPFVRIIDPSYKNKALIVDYDDTVRRSLGAEPFPTSPDEVEILPNCKEKLTEYKNKGYLLLGISNQSGIAKGKVTLENAKAAFEKTNKLLGHDIDYVFCPHSVPPVKCYCRKPQVGNAVWLIEKYKLNPKDCIFVGDLTSDATLAERCGFQYYHPNEFFKGGK